MDSNGSHEIATSVSGMVESIVGCKWATSLLALMAGGTTRPSALLRECDGLSTKVMNERLTKLVGFGIVERTAHGDKPPLEVHYTLTGLGDQFMGILDEIRRLQAWVDQHEQT